MGFMESCESQQRVGHGPSAPCALRGREGNARPQPEPTCGEERAARRRRKGGREGAASFPRPHQEHPWSRKQAGGSPAHMQRGARSEALGGQPRRSTEERAESERLNSLND